MADAPEGPSTYSFKDPMVMRLMEWGCDNDLWRKIKNKASLRKLAEKGEEMHARERLQSLRVVIEADKAAKMEAKQAAAATADAAAAPALGSKVGMRSTNGGKAKTLGEYSLYGEPQSNGAVGDALSVTVCSGG